MASRPTALLLLLRDVAVKEVNLSQHHKDRVWGLGFRIGAYRAYFKSAPMYLNPINPKPHIMVTSFKFLNSNPIYCPP